ncbi:MAG: dTMP kinase [Xenococcaceae cyanobacterium MO_188.B32]|nr:dTMP kinase [Xenococcaceae cyanobacterium MO_188.B32]
MKKKLFIVLEGIDSCGKSTQAELLKNYFINQGERAVISPEPSNGVIGNLIRSTLKKRVFFTHNRQKFDEQMAYLFAADRHDHLYNDIDGVFKLIDNGFQVIVPRYYFSSLAYNSSTPEQFAFVSKLNEKFPNPDLLIYLDIPIKISLDRLQERSLKEIYENEVKLTQVREKYQQILAKYSDLSLIIDGTKDKQIIHRQIIDFIRAKFN